MAGSNPHHFSSRFLRKDFRLILTEEQQNAVAMATETAKDQKAPSVGIIGGAAGCGKTSCLLELIKTLDCVLLAPTGKASARITEICGARASTIHKWMYEIEESHTGTLIFKKKNPQQIWVPRSRLVVVDEASMLSKDLWDDLFQMCTLIKCNILLIGDVFQLPPVSKDSVSFSVFSDDFPFDRKIVLTKVIRQAEGNPIIKIAQLIKNNEISEAMDNISVISSATDFKVQLVETVGRGGMILCYTNKTRHHLNRYYRHHVGLTDLKSGEPLLVLRNTYKLDIFNGETFLFNGLTDFLGLRSVYCPNSKKTAQLNFWKTTCNNQECIVSPEVINGQAEAISPSAIERSLSYWVRNGTPYLHCNYGYCLSTHKSQGSEGEDVILVLEPSINWFNEMGRRFIYTSVTRAKETFKMFPVSHDIESDLPIDTENKN